MIPIRTHAERHKHASTEEILQHVDVYRAELGEYKNRDRSRIYKYGGRIRGSEIRSLSGSLIRTLAMLYHHKMMDIIQLKHSGELGWGCESNQV